MKHAGQGNAAVKMTEERKRKIIKAARNRVGTSQRFLARRFGCSKTLVRTISAALKTKIPLPILSFLHHP